MASWSEKLTPVTIVSSDICCKNDLFIYGQFYRPGFLNKGNTCYMNALLQTLSVLTDFWSTLPALASEEQDISPLVAAYCQIMFLLKSLKNPIDPSCFLDEFSHFMVYMERGDFVANSQQDVPEDLN